MKNKMILKDNTLKFQQFEDKSLKIQQTHISFESIVL